MPAPPSTTVRHQVGPQSGTSVGAGTNSRVTRSTGSSSRIGPLPETAVPALTSHGQATGSQAPGSDPTRCVPPPRATERSSVVVPAPVAVQWSRPPAIASSCAEAEGRTSPASATSRRGGPGASSRSVHIAVASCVVSAHASQPSAATKPWKRGTSLVGSRRSSRTGWPAAMNSRRSAAPSGVGAWPTEVWRSSR